MRKKADAPSSQSLGGLRTERDVHSQQGHGIEVGLSPLGHEVQGGKEIALTFTKEHDGLRIGSSGHGREANRPVLGAEGVGFVAVAGGSGKELAI